MSSHYNKNISGWIILDKPQGMSSNQALRKIQYLLGAQKAGHIGTLDPFATGVLPLAFGEATKLIPYLEGTEKTYLFTLKFGSETITGDTEGAVCRTVQKVPSSAEIEAALPLFRGNITQIPPRFSAIHINGQRAYELARRGEEFALPPRSVCIKELKLLSFRKQENEADFSVTCSKGTYIRTLGCDIAESLGTCGHLTRLRRIKNGFFSLSDTILLDNLKNMLYKDNGVSPLLPVETFLCDITVIALTEEEALKLKSGQSLPAGEFQSFSGTVAACFNKKLIALIAKKENKISPIRVFNL